MDEVIALLPVIVTLAPEVWSAVQGLINDFRGANPQPTAEAIAQLQADVKAMMAQLQSVEQGN